MKQKKRAVAPKRLAVVPVANNAAGLLDQAGAAQLLGLRTGTMEVWRSEGQGPAYIKIGGRVRYRVSDIEDWLTKRTVRPTGSAA